MSIEQEKFDILYNKLQSGERQYDLDGIKQAYEFACEYHEGQKRTSGEPYVCHPIEVAKIVYEFGLDSDSIKASLLHDTVEDTEASLEMIQKKFGKDVSSLVDGVTKLGKIPYSSKEEQQIEYLRKMFFAMAKDIRVILIKLADRLHNMRTLSVRPRDKQLQTSLETMEVYAPLSHRLGMQKVKLELEDTALFYLDPDGYKMIEKRLKNILDTGNVFIEKISKIITDRLNEYKLNFTLEHRIKHIFSIYKKIFTQNKQFEEIYDIYAFRVICDSVSDCYYVLGLIHDIFNPIPGRFKDYISTPKPNMYQSLHTTVIGKDGIPFEVQIRTWQMHNTAEYGIAAHWKYKQGLNENEQAVDTKLKWIRNILEMQDELSGTEDVIKSLKIDLFSDEVFVFTPKGDVVNLPFGSNVIDFAYSIHSEVGNKMIGAKVNGKIVGFDYQLNNGEIVDIITTSSPNHGPSRDWLNLVRTTEAKNKIRQWFKREKRDENIAAGKESIEHELKKNGIMLDKEDKESILDSISKNQHFNSIDDLYAAVGYGGYSLLKIINKIKDAAIRLQKESGQVKIIPAAKTKHSDGGVIIEGIDNCLIKFAKCCNPLPGDFIIGFITKGFGVSIHKMDCANVKRSLEKEPERWIKASWDEKYAKSFSTTINILVKNDIGVVAKIAGIFADMKVAIHSINAKEKSVDTALMTITIDVKDVGHLKYITSRLMRNKSVLEVSRAVM